MRKRRRKALPRPELNIEQILAWADELHTRIGRWPRRDDGKIVSGLGLKWQSVDNALRLGFRGLPVGTSLVQLVAAQRGYRNIHQLPKLTRQKILAWADSFH